MDRNRVKINSERVQRVRDRVQIDRHTEEIKDRGFRELEQGWEFAHRFSERIAHFLPKNERMSDQSDSLTIAHFL